MSDLSKRILVALFGIPLVVLLVFFGGFLFLTLILILSNIALWEYLRLAEKKNIHLSTFLAILINSILLLIYFFSIKNIVITNFNPIFLFAIIIFFLPIFYIFIQVWNKNPNTTISVAYNLLGILWTVFSFASILSVRFLPDSLNLLNNLTEYSQPKLLFNFQYPLDDLWAAKFFLAILGTIWLCDTFAYFFGLAYGRHKLAPIISPKKTIEGAVAGYIGSLLSFFVLDFLFSLKLSIGYQILFASIVGIVGQIGDLAESKIKREFGVKDSSNILPGHGGILDRLDSIMFVFPTVFFVILLLAIL
ncbi:MAG: phosphatidate cytidylyltransferase [Ignavibacteria bacterium]|nr:phosphatidate cytidylyltransferase [Ignavibacteria bacterium]